MSDTDHIVAALEEIREKLDRLPIELEAVGERLLDSVNELFFLDTVDRHFLERNGKDRASKRP